MVSDVGEELIPFWVVKIDNLKNTLGLLEQNVGFLVLLFFDELVGDVCELH